MAETDFTADEVPAESREKGNKTEKGVTESKKLVLTPSEGELGIKITQPNPKIIDTMTRLYAVPSEKLRVWSCWLTKIGERASDEWLWWLRAQIRFALRMSELLEPTTGVPEDEEEESTMRSEEADVNVSANEYQDQKISSEPETEFEEKSSKEEKEEDEFGKEQPPVEVEDAERSVEKGDKKPGNKGKKRKGTELDKLEPKIMYEEGFWPVGVRWKPFSQRTNRKPPPQRQPDEIPIPKNEKEMTDLVRKIKHQGVIYRSLYKHWSQTAEQAVKEIVGRTVLPTKDVCLLRDEELPYFFFLDSEPDDEFAIEHEDEEVIIADPGREKITRDLKHLYFNISDKPGKGGKPWI